MKAKRILTAGGDVLTVEAGDGCWHSGEISQVEIEMEHEWTCDICGEVYDPLDYEGEES